MEHAERLEKMIEDHGSFEGIPWGTMFGKMTTLGDMTDSHVQNSIHHHYGMRYVLLGRIGYLNRPDADNTMSDDLLQMNIDAVEADIERCSFNEYLMREVQRRRGTDNG